jgi:hypothetical protein
MDLAEILQLIVSTSPAVAIWLMLRKQNMDRPLTTAQASAASMSALRDQFDIMKTTTSDLSLTIERQNATIANLRADTAAQQLVHEQAVAKTRVEMTAVMAERELASQTQIAKLQTQLTDQGVAASDQSVKNEGLLTKALEELVSVKTELRDTRGELKDARAEIADLKIMLTESRKETAEAKQETVKAEAEKKAAA